MHACQRLVVRSFCRQNEAQGTDHSDRCRVGCKCQRRDTRNRRLDVRRGPAHWSSWLSSLFITHAHHPIILHRLRGLQETLLLPHSPILRAFSFPPRNKIIHPSVVACHYDFVDLNRLSFWLFTCRAERIDVVRLRKTVRVRTDPLAAALSDDRHELGVTTVRPRRRSVFLRTERGAGILTVLAGAELVARAHLLAVLVGLVVDLTRLGWLGCNYHSNTRRQYIYIYIYIYIRERTVWSTSLNFKKNTNLKHHTGRTLRAKADT